MFNILGRRIRFGAENVSILFAYVNYFSYLCIS